MYGKLACSPVLWHSQTDAVVVEKKWEKGPKFRLKLQIET